jgi:hypothetical protein
MDGGKATRNGQELLRLHTMLDGRGFHRLYRPDKHLKHHASDLARCRTHRAKPCPVCSNVSIQRVNISFCRRNLLESRKTTYVIGMSVGQNDMSDIPRLLAQRVQSPQDGSRTARNPRVNQSATIG